MNKIKTDTFCFVHVLFYRPHIISGGFVSKIFSPDGVVISKDVANYGYDVDFRFKMKMLDLLNPINDLLIKLDA